MGGPARPFLRRGEGIGGMDHRRIQGVPKEKITREEYRGSTEKVEMTKETRRSGGSSGGSRDNARGAGRSPTSRSKSPTARAGTPGNEIYHIKLLPSRSVSPPPFRDLRRVLDLPHNLAQCSAVVAI
jgi:hypothetical protein